MTPNRVILMLALLCMIAGGACAAPTTSVHVSAIAEDGTTVLNETTVDYHWMEENLPVLGDGVTHYYHQGPVFTDDKEEQWDRNETTNFKDHGAVKATDLADICDLVGGMAPGDEVMVKAGDGYHIEFDYANVYGPDPRQGPIGICWYNGEDAAVGERQGVGYPPDYHAGMRLVFFADTSTNAEGLHVFGNQDMRECFPAERLHLFNDLYPSTNGYTVKWIDEVRVYKGGYSGAKNVPVKSLQDPAGAEQPVNAESTQSAGPLFGFLVGLGVAAGVWRTRR
ncbi:argininosuccinate synthase [Methanofollis fontis]|uniref:Argininosuccinate synthase n=1 Tax=Methanofollis fontis TaxID=2052832 RepID=A0A483CUH2_9EURY|nr:argininosuccinate synthase [Methanofollis fontis]TAJ44557.1 argininosuccinate synthase [Methanofollis fontis]